MSNQPMTYSDQTWRRQRKKNQSSPYIVQITKLAGKRAKSDHVHGLFRQRSFQTRPKGTEIHGLLKPRTVQHKRSFVCQTKSGDNRLWVIQTTKLGNNRPKSTHVGWLFETNLETADRGLYRPRSWNITDQRALKFDGYSIWRQQIEGSPDHEAGI